MEAVPAPLLARALHVPMWMGISSPA